MPTRTLGRTGLVVSRLGVGLAAIARPAYITLGRAADLPADRSVEALSARCAAILDAALAAGVRYVDVARSYGRAEEFLARWLAARALDPGTLTIGSKWGYRYTGAWRRDAAVHEEKELSCPRFARQLAESRALLGPHLALYQIHSATAESGCLEDTALLGALVAGRRRGAYRALGLTLSGPTSARALALALAACIDGERVFDVVQATFNVLESSLAGALAEAHAAGMGVIVKETHANGRLTAANTRAEDAELRTRLAAIADALAHPHRVGSRRRPARGPGIDQLALAFALAHPFVDVALSGAATVGQLASHVGALAFALDDETRRTLGTLAEPPGRYWATRGTLPWS